MMSPPRAGGGGDPPPIAESLLHVVRMAGPAATADSCNVGRRIKLATKDWATQLAVL